MTTTMILLPGWLTSGSDLTLATWGLVGATLLLAATGIAGILFAGWQLRNERSQRRVENLEHQLDTWEGERYRNIRAKLAEERLRQDTLRDLNPADPPDQVYDVLDFFEHIAILVRKGNLSAFDVWHSFGPWIGPAWADFREVIAVEQTRSPVTYCDFLYLARRLEKIEKKQGGDYLDYSEQELEGHYCYERYVAKSIEAGERRRPKKRRKPVKEQQVPPSSNGSIPLAQALEAKNSPIV